MVETFDAMPYGLHGRASARFLELPEFEAGMGWILPRPLMKKMAILASESSSIGPLVNDLNRPPETNTIISDGTNILDPFRWPSWAGVALIPWLSLNVFYLVD